MTEARPAEIAAMDRGDLLALWRGLFETDAPRSISVPLLRRMLAFEVQARRLGGLDAQSRRALARARSAGTRKTTVPLRPGGRLVREWNGVVHVVEAAGDGFLWQGARWRSLSAIAREITGTRWSGPRFFGLAEDGSAP